MAPFTYTAGLPNPPDNPSQDVGGMQINSESISSLIAIDHIGFNNSQGGQHKQVTFASVNVPMVPTTPPVLFTNTKDGAGNTLPGSLPELFFYSGTAAQGQNNYLSQGNITTTSQGSVLLFGGIVMKWGTAAAGASSISFTSPFPNALFNVTMTGYATGAVFNVIGSPNATSFSFSPTVSGGNLMFWLAIGN